MTHEGEAPNGETTSGAAPGFRIVTGGSTDFPVTFADPADADLTWERDDMHMPFALTPLAADFVRYCIAGGFNPPYEAYGAPRRLFGGVWNGWAYFAFQANVPKDEEDASEARWVETLRSRIPVTAAYWADEVLPELRAIFDWVAGLAVEEVPAAEAAGAWLEAWRRVRRSWVLHFFSIMAPYQVLEDLSDAYAIAMGAGHDAEALALVSGSWHELEDVEEAIEELTELARTGDLGAAIDAAAAHTDATAPIDLAELRTSAAAGRFVDALESFLGEHGHLGQNHDDLRLASWGEAPRLLLGQIATRLRQPTLPARQRAAALARKADGLAAAARAALADRPDELAKFDATLAHAREIGYLTEGHNYWIDRLSHARLRALSLRVGARLVRDGVLGQPDDVFFLGRDEVADALRDGANREALIAERRAAHAAAERMDPPYFVGKPPDKPSTGDRFDSTRVASTEVDMLRGTGASAGVIRGPARVTLSQDDFGRIQPGDVIVCPSSNPSWVPAFTIAGGLVTNTGGVLSHAAVVAREFGLPAVVGTGDATTRIADGRMVELDGTAGTVRLL